MREVKIEVVSGPAGQSVYIDDHRVAGPKPWGGGRTLCAFRTELRHVLTALKIESRSDAAENGKP